MLSGLVVGRLGGFGREVLTPGHPGREVTWGSRGAGNGFGGAGGDYRGGNLAYWLATSPTAWWPLASRGPADYGVPI